MSNSRENPVGGTETGRTTPSDTLLKNFRVTLETRWKEFDQATMKEAEEEVSRRGGIFGSLAAGFGVINVAEERGKNEDFMKAKAAFDEAKAMLATVSTDADLKKSTDVLRKVEDTLKSLTSYLASMKPEEKAKSHNIILARTTADLAKFKAEMTGNEADKQEAVRVDAAEKAIVRPAVVAGAAAATIPFISSAEAREVTGEVTGEIKKALGPWGMIFKGVKDVPTKEVASQIKEIAKEYTEKKWMDSPLDKFFAMIKLFFLKWQIKKAGIDLSKDMTAEEMRLAGIIPQNPKSQTDTTTEDSSKKFEKNYGVASTILSEIANDEAKKGHIASIYPLSSIKTLKYKDIKADVSNTRELRRKIGVGNDVTDIALLTFIRPIIDENHSLYSMFQSSFMKANPGKKIEDATLYEIIGSIGPGVRILSTMKKIDITDLAGTAEELASSFIKVDTDSDEVSGELVAQAEGLNISKKILKVLFKNRTGIFPKDGDLTTLLKDPTLTPEEQAQIGNIRNFGIAFQKKLVSDTGLNFGNGEVMQKIVQNGGMNIGDVLKAYILTGGKTDFSEMTAVEKVGAYTSFFLIAGADPEGSGALTGSLVNMENLIKLAQGTSVFDKIPDDVQRIMRDHFGVDVALKKVGQLAGSAGEALAGFAKKSPGFATILTICVLFLPVFSKRTNLTSILLGRK